MGADGRLTRVRPIRSQCRGAVGAFSYLLERYPALRAWLELQIRRRKVLLEQLHSDGSLRMRMRGLSVVHQELLQQCRSIGLTAVDYPFNTKDRAI
jgi:putative transposase